MFKNRAIEIKLARKDEKPSEKVVIDEATKTEKEEAIKSLVEFVALKATLAVAGIIVVQTLSEIAIKSTPQR